MFQYNQECWLFSKIYSLLNFLTDAGKIFPSIMNCLACDPIAPSADFRKKLAFELLEPY
jgi:hypothetical protein